MLRRSVWITAVLAVGLVVCPAQAQPEPDPNLPATYGSVTLKSGFLPDPYVKEVLAGGELRTNLGGVKAHVARAPDFSLHYTKGSYPLTFHVRSVGDTTLLINLPDGTWIADDDSGGNLDPLIRIAKPQSGRYDIYVGTYRKGLIAATLHITERNVGAEAPPPPPPAGKDLPSCYLVSAGVDNYRNANKLEGCLNDARNTVAAFQAQKGWRFSNVRGDRPLLDAQATRANILKHFQGFTQQGGAHDFVVLFLSGHGGRTNGNRTWYFLPFDFHPDQPDTLLTDRQILDAADALVQQKKHVVIIIDACFCGQLYQTAQSYLARYQNPQGGSLTLMLSSAAEQTSAALGNYSAFAKAFYDGMSGGADLKHDGKITLGEIKTYTARRTAELLTQSRMRDRQDCIVAWSPSLSKDTLFAATRKVAAVANRPPPTGTPTRWSGTETLANYGKLSFAMYPGGRVVMVDAKETSEGVWRHVDNHYTLSFFDGAVVYTGTVSGNTLSGMATAPSSRRQPARSWSWTATRQPAN